MTEQEAKTKWCPLARGKGGVNRADAGENTLLYGNCIGSACMAWRTAEKFGDGKPYLGYCGLAGKP